MPRGTQKRWHPGIAAGVIEDNPRYVKPMPRGALPDKKQQHKGRELAATVASRTNASVADFWSVKGMPLNGRGNKSDAGSY